VQGVQAHHQNSDLSKIPENMVKISENPGKNGAQRCLS